MFISNTNSLQSFLPEFWQWMLLWDEKRQTVEVIAACLGPSEQLVLCISWKKSRLIQGSPAAPWRHPAWGYEPIQDNPWKHHISVAVPSTAGFNIEGPILNRNLLWKLFNMFFFKGSNLFCLLGFFPLELCLSFWHLTGMDPTRTGTRARLISTHCGFSCSSACLEKAQWSSWAIDLPNYIIFFYLFLWILLSFSLLTIAGYANLCLLVGHPGHDDFQSHPPSVGFKLLPALHVAQLQPHDICAICRKCLSKPGGWK